MKKEFVRYISHEIRTPLNTVSMGLLLLEQEVKKGASTTVLLGIMDDIYSIMVTMDYPDAITNGLRRQTDLARSIIEKTRGDITFSLRGEYLTQAISQLSAQLNSDSFNGQKRSG